MAGDVIGPVPRQSAPPLLPQRAAQLSKKVPAPAFAVVIDFVRPKADQSRQIAGAAVGLSRLGRIAG